MLFNSWEFLLGFLPVTWAGYWLLRRSTAAPSGAAVLMLGVASYVFYVYGETRYPWLILVSMAFNFAVARALTRLPGGRLPGGRLPGGRLPGGRRRRLVFAAGIAGDLAMLGWFKYAGFLAANLHVFGVDLAIGAPALPIGISFFTFTQIAFLVDVNRREATEVDPARYGLFVTFFPHLIAGPILHHREMMPQFARLNSARPGEGRGAPIAALAAGLPMLAIGLFKKCVVADSIGPVATTLFAHAQVVHAQGQGGSITVVDGWMAALSYTVQIYFDFSGYCDMAIGLARMFAIDLPINFNAPYQARSIVEFWRRWHITLSRFLRDYLYVPLGGNRRGRWRRYANLLATMVLGGLWHGAGWTFVAWGALHGAFLVAAHLWRARPAYRPMAATAGRALTLAGVVVAWVAFRAPDMATAAAIWGGMAGLHGLHLPAWPGMAGLARTLGLPLDEMGFGRGDAALVAAALLGCLALPTSQALLARFRLGLDTPGYHALEAGQFWLKGLWAKGSWAKESWALPRHWATALAAGIVLGVALRFMGGYSEFLYFQF